MLNDDQNNRLDLNLLSVFDAVMSERSLTKAGRRLGITQSAVSHALARLRDVTGDALFERTGRGVRPTARATEMAEDVRSALDQLRATLRANSNGFDAARSDRTFLIEIPAGLESLILPPLAKRVAKAPGIRIRVASGQARTAMHDLRTGDTWLALDAEDPQAPGYRTQLLFEEAFVLAARRNHPAFAKPFTLADFQAADHVVTEWSKDRGPTPSTVRLQNLGIKRRVRFAVPSFVAMAAILNATDAIGIMPERVARSMAEAAALQIHALPVALPPLPVYMVWHEIFDRDEGHRWLRQQFKDVCEAI